MRRNPVLYYPWLYKNLCNFLLQSPVGATSYAFTWQIIHISILGVSSSTISRTKETKNCWCSMKDCVFISGSASLSQSLPHTTIHYLFVRQGKLSWGPIVCLVEFWLCVTVFVAPLLCIQEVSGRLGMQSRIPEESLGSRGPVLPSSPCWAAGGARHEDSRMGGGGGMGANEQKRC